MQAVVQSGSFVNFQVHDGIIMMGDPCSVSFMLIVLSLNFVTIQTGSNIHLLLIRLSMTNTMTMG